MACRARSRPCLAEPPAESPSTMKISESSRPELLQSESLPGSARRDDVADLRVTSCCGRAAGLAGARREHDARDDRLGDADVVVQPVLERRTNRAVERRHHLRVVQPILGLPLELRLRDEEAQHSGEPFANVVGGERHALRREVVRLDEIAHRLADSGAQAVLVRAARGGGDAVDVAADVLVGGLGPLQDAVEPEAVLALDTVKAASCTGFAPRSATIFRRYSTSPSSCAKRAFSPVLSSSKATFSPLCRKLEISSRSRMIAGVELDLREDRRVGMEVDRRSRCRGRGRSSSAAPWACPA